MSAKLSDFNFGEYDGRQEYLREERYFLDSFLMPPNFNINNVSNKKKFIIIGHKGVGKSSVQLFIEKVKSSDGYLTGFMSFYDDLNPSDYLEFSKTQKISFVEIANAKNITALYDFRDVWVRIFLKKIAEMLSLKESKFTKLMLATHRGSRSLVDSIVAGLKISADFNAIFADIGLEYDFSKLGSRSEMRLSDFNDVALKALVDHHSEAKIYFSVDELVVSNFESKSDEYKVRMALIRDVMKSANYLNNFFVKNNIDINIICSLRPEVRDVLYSLDSDISKFLDSCYVSVDWYAVEDESHPLIEVLYKKIAFGSPTRMTIQEAKSLFRGDMNFTRESLSIPFFMLRQSWHRPRDVVRFLKCYADRNSVNEYFTPEGISKSLDDYSRISARECFDEIAVKYSQDVVAKLRDIIREKKYNSYDQFLMSLDALSNRLNIAELAEDLFKSGVIYNVDNVNGKNRYFAAHRGNDSLYRDMAIYVHHGLWNYFAVRHKNG